MIPSGEQLVWFLVVDNDGDGVEGSWGRDGEGRERETFAADGNSGHCGISSKLLTNTCGLR